MARMYRDEGSARGRRPATLRKLVATVFAVVCIVGPAMAKSWDAASVRFIAPAGYGRPAVPDPFPCRGIHP